MASKAAPRGFSVQFFPRTEGPLDGSRVRHSAERALNRERDVRMSKAEAMDLAKQMAGADAEFVAKGERDGKIYGYCGAAGVALVEEA